MTDISKLLSLSAEKDQEAFNILYDQTSQKLFRLALHYMGRRSLAEEVLQETYIKIWNKAGDYDSSRGHALTWMSVITRNTALDVKRSLLCRPEEVETTYEGDDFVASDSNLSLEIKIEYLEEINNLQRHLNKLNPEQRKCIIYNHYYGYSHRELSEMMGKPLGTIKTWLKRSADQFHTH